MLDYICDHCDEIRDAQFNGIFHIKIVRFPHIMMCCRNCLPEVINDLAHIAPYVSIHDMSVESSELIPL